MNIKAIALGTIAFFITYFAVGTLTGLWIHQQILHSVYASHPQLWQPAFQNQGMNGISLMPVVLTFTFITAVLLTMLYSNLRDGFAGSPIIKGIKFGLMLWVIASLVMLAWTAVFNVPTTLWIWWSIDLLIKFTAASAVMAWAVERFSR
jgi:hypothetical protein